MQQASSTILTDSNVNIRFSEGSETQRWLSGFIMAMAHTDLGGSLLKFNASKFCLGVISKSMNEEVDKLPPPFQPQVAKTIVELVANGFFNSPKSSGDLREYYRVKHSQILHHSLFSTPLRRAFERGLLTFETDVNGTNFYTAPDPVKLQTEVRKASTAPRTTVAKQSPTYREIITELIAEGYLNIPRTPGEMRTAWKSRTGVELPRGSFNVTVHRTSLAGKLVSHDGGRYSTP